MRPARGRWWWWEETVIQNSGRPEHVVLVNCHRWFQVAVGETHPSSHADWVFHGERALAAPEGVVSKNRTGRCRTLASSRPWMVTAARTVQSAHQ